MALDSNLHRRLIKRQSDEELRRKADKARARSVLTQEDQDWSERPWARWHGLYQAMGMLDDGDALKEEYYRV